jgi:hypothetical protein
LKLDFKKKASPSPGSAYRAQDPFFSPNTKTESTNGLHNPAKSTSEPEETVKLKNEIRMISESKNKIVVEMATLR